MSMHSSILMIQGNHLQSLPDVFSRFDYRQTRTAERSEGLERTVEAIAWQPWNGKPRNIVHKAACVLNGWTVILDPEMVMVAHGEKCAAVSKMLHSKLFGMLCEGTSGTYAYRVCDGDFMRWFLWQDGQILEDVGDRVPEEPPVDDIDEVTVLEMMARLGADFSDLEQVSEFQVYEFDESRPGSEPEPSAPAPLPIANSVKSKKPWWQFW